MALFFSYQEQRLCQIQERIDKEKKAALELQKRNEYLNLASLSQKDQFVSTSFKTGEKNVVFSEMGWTPQTNVTDVVKVVDNEDPIVQQISIIQNYIQQAKKAQKFEEVSMLEANLRELWNEYYKQKDPYFDNR